MAQEIPPEVRSLYGHRLLTLSDEQLHGRWSRLRRAEAKVEALLREGFRQGLRETGKDVTKSIMMEMVRGVMSDSPVDVATWDLNVGGSLKRNLALAVPRIIIRSMREGTKFNMAGIDLSKYEAQLNYDRLDDFAENYAARVIWYANDTSREGMNAFIDRSLDRGRDENMIATLAKRIIGLGKPEATAAERYMRALEDQEKSFKVRDAKFRIWSNTALDRRSELFARTEAMTAANFAQQYLWESAMRDGVIPEGSRKVWVTAADERVCPVCVPMDKQAVPMSEQFETKNGKVLVPPIHPRCRCTIIPEAFLGTLGERGARTRGRNLAA